MAIAVILNGCASVQLISDYDETTDKALTALQTKTADFVESLKKEAGTSAAAFDKHKAFYEEIDRDLRMLEFRVESIPQNDKSVALVKDIRSVLLGDGTCSEEGTSLMDLHCIKDSKARGPSVRALEIAQRNINQTIGAALSLELAKKQGTDE